MKNKIKKINRIPGFRAPSSLKRVRACARVHVRVCMRACVPTPCHRPPSPEVPVVVLGVDVDTLVGEQQLDHLGIA